MIPRVPGDVAARLVAGNGTLGLNAVNAWVRTTGGASPSISTSYGVSSITDAAVGKMDITFSVPFASATSFAGGVSIEGGSPLNNGRISSGSLPTATTMRVMCISISTAATTDPQVGYMVFAVGY